MSAICRSGGVIGVLTIYRSLDPGRQDNGVLTTLIAIDGVAVIIVAGFVIRQILQPGLNVARKWLATDHWRLAGTDGRPGCRATVFALFVVDYSLRGWFADQISTAVTGSVQVADSISKNAALFPRCSDNPSDVVGIPSFSDPDYTCQYRPTRLLRNLSKPVFSMELGR